MDDWVIDFRLKYKRKKGVVSFRAVVLEDNGDEVIYEGSVFGDPTWVLGLVTDKVEIPSETGYRTFVPGPMSADLKVGLRGAVDPKAPIIRTRKPKRDG